MLPYPVLRRVSSPSAGSFSFRDLRLSVFSLPLRRGRARVGVKAGGVPRPCFSPPSQPSPTRGEGVEGPGKRRENRELNDPGYNQSCLTYEVQKQPRNLSVPTKSLLPQRRTTPCQALAHTHPGPPAAIHSDFDF